MQVSDVSLGIPGRLNRKVTIMRLKRPPIMRLNYES